MQGEITLIVYSITMVVTVIAVRKLLMDKTEWRTWSIALASASCGLVSSYVTLSMVGLVLADGDYEWLDSHLRGGLIGPIIGLLLIAVVGIAEWFLSE